MYPSVLLLPLPMAGIYLLKKTAGPLKTLNFNAQISQKIFAFTRWIDLKELPFTPGRIHCELAILQHLTPHSLFACFELACAFQLWLAAHGESSEVVLGKCIIDHKIRMHAWVKTENAVFFKDGEFDIVDWSTALNV